MASEQDDRLAAAPASSAPTLVCDFLPGVSALACAPSGYEILEEVGRGGMGVVYKARQAGLERTVALKMILAGPHAGPQEVGRFRAEAQAAARLQHPNIVQIHHVGEHEGVPFMALEFVSGGSLADRFNGTPWRGRDAAALVETLSRAIHSAHQQGVIHRDLKPANVLLAFSDASQKRSGEERFCEASLNGCVPKITDFGLAKRVGADGPTLTGQVLGTPSYMAPEQAEPRRHPVGPATDVYGLGAILYELLTGRPPFVAETPLDTILHLLSDQPAPPRLLNSKVDRDLESICLKCLEKDPRQRYPGADELADDLARYLNGETIRARSINLLSRVARTLEGSGHAPEFRGWSSLLLVLAAIVFVGHLITFLVLSLGLPSGLDTVSRAVQFVLAAVLFWRFRPQTVLPTTAGERLLWSIWVGYFLAHQTVLAVKHLLVRQGLLAPGPAAPPRWLALLPYPFLALLSGLAFFAMGSAYWGRYYAFGLAFFVLAAVMPLWLSGAPLLLGTLWAVCLILIALHLRRLSSENPDTASRDGKAFP